MEKTSEMRAWRRSLAAAAAALALAACTGGLSGGQSDTPARVRIGLLAPLTGSRSAAGRDALRGAQLAAELVNQSSNLPLPLAAGVGLPGLGGATLQVDAADTGGDPAGAPERAATQAIRLVGQRVAGLVSVGDTATTAVASERTERVGVPFVDGGAPADYLSQRGMNWYFRTAPSDRFLGERLLSMLQQTRGGSGRKLAIVHSRDSAGTDMSAALEGLAGEGGYDVVTDVAMPAPPASANAVVDQVRGAAPDALIAATSQPADATALLASFRALAWHPPVTMAMGAGFVAPLSSTALEADPSGVLLSDSWSAEVAQRNPVARQMGELYKRRFGGDMTEAAAKGFTATLVLAQAIDAARSVDVGRVRAALLALDVPGRDTIMPWDGVRFDEAGQNTRAAAVVEQLTPAGVRAVFPPELATPA
jgi:branched-chain amino acid transport system substrate-binding protein